MEKKKARRRTGAPKGEKGVEGEDQRLLMASLT